MDPVFVGLGIPALLFLLLFVLRGLRQVNQWEVALKFTLGKFTGKVEPGLSFVAPLFQQMIRVDTRIRNRDLPSQQVITRDNVTATIDAVVYFKVVDVEKATLNVENFELAVKDRAKVVLRDVVGEMSLEEVLANRDEVAAKVRLAVEQFVSKWGLHVELIALQDIQLPPSIQDAMAKRAIAEREKQAVIIKSQADLESAQNFADAARLLDASPGGMELRRLEALQNITGQGNSKVIFDLAKPHRDPRSEAAGIAAALAEDHRFRIAPVQSAPELAERAQAEEEQERSVIKGVR